jgi:phytoene dehydrogenase-like protein
LYSNFDKKSELLKKDILARSKEFIQLASTPLHSYVKKYFKNPQLQQILEYPMVFLGSSPYSAPALFSLMSALDFDEGVYYPKGVCTPSSSRWCGLANAKASRIARTTMLQKSSLITIQQ